MIFAYETITLCGCPFQEHLANQITIFAALSRLLWNVSNLQLLPYASCEAQSNSRLDSFSLAATKEILSFPLGTMMFRFPRCRYPAINAGLFWFITKMGFPIRKSPDQRLRVTSPRLIADSPRPSSPRYPKASTVCS